MRMLFGRDSTAAESCLQKVRPLGAGFSDAPTKEYVGGSPGRDAPEESRKNSKSTPSALKNMPLVVEAANSWLSC